MGALFFLIVIVCVVIVLVKAGNKDEKSGGTLVLPEDEVPQGTPTWRQRTELKEEAVRIYLHEPQIRGWCCPNCECENEYSSTKCCVCNYERR